MNYLLAVTCGGLVDLSWASFGGAGDGDLVVVVKGFPR